jgi:hypothetical protein
MEEALAWRTTLFRKVFFESLFTGNLTAEVCFFSSRHVTCYPMTDTP